MISGLSKSPITARKIFEWKSKLESNEVLVRQIIDIDSSYVDIDTAEEDDSSKDKKQSDTKSKKISKDIKKDEVKEDKEKNKEGDSEYTNENEDEFNPSLAMMEEEIKPQVISTMNFLFKNYNKLIKYQREKLECVLKAKEFSRAKDKGYKIFLVEIVNQQP